MSGDPHAKPYVSRGGLKLEAALRAFEIDPSGLVCGDLGCHVGGFVDCLLRHGALRVHAVDTGYGVLDYSLRKDARVVVHERQNALDFICDEPCRLISIDVGWTPQRLVLPAALRSLDPQAGRIITLVKPHYEAPNKKWLRRGVLRPEYMDEVLDLCRGDMRELGWHIGGEVASPITGHGGNTERLFLLDRNKF